MPLDPSFHGLDSAEAARRLAAEGPNVLSVDGTRPLSEVALSALREPMFLLLAVAAAIYTALGDLGEGLLLGAAGLVAIGLVVGQRCAARGR